MNRVQQLRDQMVLRKNILLIGSGLMAETLIDHLLQRDENHIVIASLLLEEAQSLASRKKRCSAIHLDVQDSIKLDSLVRDSDIVVAYLPPQFIVPIAKCCLHHARNLVTSQYMFPELKAMHEEASCKGVIFLNEIGLDPGIDHLATYSLHEKVKAKGGKVVEYESWCGGLPAPEHTDNPFGYKFSWSPLAAIKNVNNDARFYENSEVQHIPGTHLLYSRQTIKLNPALALEGYPNRDSTQYKELYGLEHCTKVIRGTLRYPGFSVIMSGLRNLGLMTEEKIPKEWDGISFFTYLNRLLVQEDTKPQKLSQYLVQNLAKEAHTNNTHSIQEVELLLTKIFNRVLAHDYYDKKHQHEAEEDARQVFEAMDWLSMFDENLKIKGGISHVENTGSLMHSKMLFKPGETDLVAMQHIFRVTYPNDERVHVKKSTLIMTGEKHGRTAMAKTVSIPTAIAIQLILDNRIPVKGVHIPNLREINEPLIAELEKHGLMCQEEDV